MFIATSLSYYKRLDVRKEIVAQAQDKEISVIFNKSHFSKRPDVLSYEQDVFEFAKKKASSFHCSEELWHNPLSIASGMKRHELDELRKGWDLLLDVDCPDWEVSKLITHLFIKALEDHQVKSVSVKFSGNKGFHIGVPFQAFPEKIFFDGSMKETRTLFPELPKRIALYLLSYITSHYVKIADTTISILDKVFSHQDLEKVAKKSGKTLFARQCVDCAKEYKQPFAQKKVYECDNCGHQSRPQGNPEYIRCEKCTHPVQVKTSSPSCSFCGSKKPPRSFLNLLAVIEIDTVLLASRHLYRMPYSLHEKSGLISLPIGLDEVLTFDKDRAKPFSAVVSSSFLDRSHASAQETEFLLQEVLGGDLAKAGHIYLDDRSASHELKEVELPEHAIEEQYFPPCMQLILKGLDDGKKRALFVLLNFLSVSGWTYPAIESFIYEWNERNPEPLKEQYLKGQLAQLKKGKKPMPPPNCDNHDYYTSLLVCKPDGFCSRIKNPAMYAKRKSQLASRKKPRKKSSKKSQKGEKKEK